MSQAPAYNPTESFADSERNNAGGRSTVRTAMLDAELAAEALSINALRANLALIQRDDGKLLDVIVEPYNLSIATQAYVLATKWVARGKWATSTSYAVNDLVDQGGSGYVCAIAHTSGTFATDYAAGKWQIFTNPTIASAIAFTPTTTLSSTNVQSAIEEADTNARTDSALLLSNFYGGF